MDINEFQAEEIGKLESILSELGDSLMDSSVCESWKSLIWHLRGAKGEAELLIREIANKISEANEYMQVERIENEEQL